MLINVVIAKVPITDVLCYTNIRKILEAGCSKPKFNEMAVAEAQIAKVRDTSRRYHYLGTSDKEIVIWQIEVFFKTCKSMLNLTGECHSLSYDAISLRLNLFHSVSLGLNLLNLAVF